MQAKSQTTLRANIESITGLPTLPTVAQRIMRLLENPQTTVEEIGKAIAVDQSLASKVLKLVNSAFYGFPGKISTISHAIVILGFSTIKNVVLTTSIFDAFRKKSPGLASFSIEQFWYHCIACGAASQTLARHAGFEDRETCFIAGLIHDIGKTILCNYAPQEFAQALDNAKKKGILFYDSEKELFDITHPEIGGLLADRWNLPDTLKNAVRFHHAPAHTHNHYSVAAIVHTADILVRALDFGIGCDDKIPIMSEQVWKDLALDNVPLQPLLEGISDDVKKATVFMQVI